MSELKSPLPFLDLSAEYEGLEAEWFEAIRIAGRNGQFILGPNVQAFEEEFAHAVGVKHAVAVANGTDALLLSLRALGIGPGDEVITTPYTFFATAEVITHVGATPVFVDIEADSFNIDVHAIAARIGERTRAVIPVHLFGHPAEMDEIMAIAEDRGLRVIEDCAQAFGANVGRKRVGSFGASGCFSFYPTKILGCYGDGGMITTGSASLAQQLRKLRNHGATAPFTHDTAGYNSRLDEIQAALLRIKLRNIEQSIRQRRELAERYCELLHDTDVVRPSLPHQGGHVFNLFTIRTPRRDEVRAALTARGIASSVCYPLPLHLQDVYSGLGYRPGDLPVAERAARESLSLPIYPGMSEEDVMAVCETIVGVLNG